jgi:altronate dehydratase
MNPVPALVISPRDNVATALEPLAAGRTIVLAGQSITITETTPRGHKIALRPIRQGEEIYKYGSTIGTATCDIQAGSHVHTHNVASGRGRAPQKNKEEHGQADANATSPDGPRLAEPPDRSPVTGRSPQ